MRGVRTPLLRVHVSEVEHLGDIADELHVWRDGRAMYADQIVAFAGERGAHGRGQAWRVEIAHRCGLLRRQARECAQPARELADVHP